MNTRAKPSRFKSKSSRSAGSNACAATPFDCRAASTPRPESSEIWRSSEGPPMSRATLPKPLALRGSHDAHLAHELDPGLRRHRRLHVVDDRLDVGSERAAEVHDEIRVLGRDLRGAD